MENVPLRCLNLDLGNNNLEDVSSLADFMAAQPQSKMAGILIFRCMKTGLKISVRWPKSSDWVMYLFKTTAIRDITPLKAKTEIWHLDLQRNDISVLADTFDAYQIRANIYLDGNTLLCSEVSNLENSTANIQWTGDCGEDD